MAEKVTIVARRRGSTNDEIADAWRALGVDARVLAPEQTLGEVSPGDVVVARLDVLESLDGIEPGLDEIETLIREGCASSTGPAPSAPHTTSSRRPPASRRRGYRTRERCT